MEIPLRDRHGSVQVIDHDSDFDDNGLGLTQQVHGKEGVDLIAGSASGCQKKVKTEILYKTIEEKEEEELGFNKVKSSEKESDADGASSATERDGSSDRKHGFISWIFDGGGIDLKLFPSIGRVRLRVGLLNHPICYSVTFALMIFAPFVGVESALTTSPVNTMVVAGQNVRLNCSTNSQGVSRDIYWAKIPMGNGRFWLYYGTKIGFNGQSWNKRYSIDINEKEGRFDLLIADTKPTDAGTYICVDEAGMGMEVAAEIVITETLSCETNFSPGKEVMGQNVFGLNVNDISASCSLKYTGNTAPSLVWERLSDLAQSDVTIVTNPESVKTTMTMAAKRELNGKRFNCRVTLSTNSSSSSSSSFIASTLNDRNEKQQTWSSDPIVVKYAVYDNANEVKACNGATKELLLVCNPPCSYEKQRKDDGQCRCLTTYDVEGNGQTIYNVTSEQWTCAVDETKSDAALTRPVILAVAGCLAALLGAFVLLILYLKFRNKKTIPTDLKLLCFKGMRVPNTPTEALPLHPVTLNTV